MSPGQKTKRTMNDAKAAAFQVPRSLLCSPPVPRSYNPYTTELDPCTSISKKPLFGPQALLRLSRFLGSTSCCLHAGWVPLSPMAPKAYAVSQSVLPLCASERPLTSSADHRDNCLHMFVSSHFPLLLTCGFGIRSSFWTQAPEQKIFTFFCFLMHMFWIFPKGLTYLYDTLCYILLSFKGF